MHFASGQARERPRKTTYLIIAPRAGSALVQPDALTGQRDVMLLI